MDRTITVRIVTTTDLPDSTGGMCEQTGSDSYMIVVNGNKTSHEQIVAFLHECLHIWHDDFSAQAVDSLEASRHRELETIGDLGNS